MALKISKEILIMVILIALARSVSSQSNFVFISVDGAAVDGEDLLIIGRNPFLESYQNVSIYIPEINATYTLSQEVLIVDGASMNNQSYLIVVRNPFPGGHVVELGSSVFVDITYPIGGGSYWTNTLPINASINGLAPLTCRYRINGAAWNAYNCVSQNVTFPFGSVVLEVEAIDGLGQSGSDVISFRIDAKGAGAIIGAGGGILFVGILLTFIILGEDDKKKELSGDPGDPGSKTG